MDIDKDAGDGEGLRGDGRRACRGALEGIVCCYYIVEENVWDLCWRSMERCDGVSCN